MFQYFAYGSNMLTERLVRRCPSAIPFGPTIANGYQIRFAKKGRDGSGKATLVQDRDQTIHGVLFTISISDLDALHRAEGLGNGYDFEETFQVFDPAGNRNITASTYIASIDAYDENLKPFDWYRALVLAGATQHCLPAGYVNRFHQVTGVPDSDHSRPGRTEAMDILKSAGFAHLVGE